MMGGNCRSIKIFFCFICFWVAQSNSLAFTQTVEEKAGISSYVIDYEKEMVEIKKLEKYSSDEDRKMIELIQKDLILPVRSKSEVEKKIKKLQLYLSVVRIDGKLLSFPTLDSFWQGVIDLAIRYTREKYCHKRNFIWEKIDKKQTLVDSDKKIWIERDEKYELRMKMIRLADYFLDTNPFFFPHYRCVRMGERK